MELLETSDPEVIDFRGFGQVNKAFVPLLDKVCSAHPSLIECQADKKQGFTKQAFHSLGRILYFLEHKRVRDLNEQCYKEIKTLLDEVKPFGFDLTWLYVDLEPIFAMKEYVSAALELEKLEEEVFQCQVRLDVELQFLESVGFEGPPMETLVYDLHSYCMKNKNDG